MRRVAVGNLSLDTARYYSDHKTTFTLSEGFKRFPHISSSSQPIPTTRSTLHRAYSRLTWTVLALRTGLARSCSWPTWCLSGYEQRNTLGCNCPRGLENRGFVVKFNRLFRYRRPLRDSIAVARRQRHAGGVIRTRASQGPRSVPEPFGIDVIFESAMSGKRLSEI